MCLNLPPTVTSWVHSPWRSSRTSARLGPSGVLYFHKVLYNNKVSEPLQPQASCRAAPYGRSRGEWLKHHTEVITYLGTCRVMWACFFLPGRGLCSLPQHEGCKYVLIKPLQHHFGGAVLAHTYLDLLERTSSCADRRGVTQSADSTNPTRSVLTLDSWKKEQSSLALQCLMTLPVSVFLFLPGRRAIQDGPSSEWGPGEFGIT